MTAVLTISAILFGVLAFRRLPVNDLPNVDYPVIQVTASYPGASPLTMANNVATPLERQFMQIAGLELVTSQSRQGLTSLTLQFDGSKSAVRIKVDPEALAVRGFGVDNLAAAIGAGTTYQGAGQFDGASRSFLLQPKGQLETAAEYADLVVGVREGSPIHLRDVADVRDGVVDERLSKIGRAHV